jgi:hypothetical protein
MNHPYTVVMLDTETGEQRTSPPYNFPFGHFWWTEGNFGCGCNRQAEWHRAAPDFEHGQWVEYEDEYDGGYRHPELGDLFGDCSSTRYSVLYATLADGTRVNIDIPDEPEDEVAAIVADF